MFGTDKYRVIYGNASPLCARYHQMLQTLKATMILVVESLINKFDEDQLRKEEMHREIERCQSNRQFADNCSDSDSSFHQVRRKKKKKKNVCDFGLCFCFILIFPKSGVSKLYVKN